VAVETTSLAVARSGGTLHRTDARRNLCHARHLRRDRDPPRDDPGVDGPHRRSKGWAQTRAAIVAAFEREGRFDGVLGFQPWCRARGAPRGAARPDGVTTEERPLRFDFAIVGMGLAMDDRSDVGSWTKRALAWLRARGVIDAAGVP
jgi:hypothetical protein